MSASTITKGDSIHIEEKSQETSQKNSKTAFYQLKDNYLRIYLSFDKNKLLASGEDASNNNRNTRAGAGGGQRSLFVLDYSSSMSHEWKQVQAAVKYFIDNSDELTISKTDFIIYSSNAKMATVDEILRMRANGMTSFESAFEQIILYLTKLELRNEMVNIIFMTDGHDNCTKDMPQALSNLGSFINNSIDNPVVMHTIGFSANHDRTFLEKLCNLSNDQKGIYRFADNKASNDNENGNLAEKFEEMFDFLAVSNTTEITINHNIKMIADIENRDTYKIDISGGSSSNNSKKNKNSNGMDDNNTHEIDIIIDLKSKQNDLAYGALVNKIKNSTDGNNVIDICLNGINNSQFECNLIESDQLFDLKRVEIMAITTESQLEKAQTILNSIKIHRIKHKYFRKKAQFLQYLIQLKLNKAYQIFSKIKRGLISKSDDSVIAELNSLRYETTFSKARQQRAMDKRILKNMGLMDDIHEQLNQLEFPPNDDIMNKLFKSDKTISSLKCLLSNDSIFDIMNDSNDNVMVFTMAIERAEHLIDAPTSVIIKKYLVGFYSFEAIKDATRFAIDENGTNQALGGFIQSKQYKIKYGVNGDQSGSCQNNNNNNNDDNDNDDDNEVGLFRGVDGSKANSYLPLYLNSEHFKRVEILLPPILGYFFTLDPLGFKPNQYLALYFILGHMVCKNINKTKKTQTKNEWFDWLVNDFTQLCTHLLPTVKKYLLKETNGILGNTIKSGELLNEWINDENMRFSKQVIQNLLVLIGLHRCYTNQNNNNNKSNSDENETKTQSQSQSVSPAPSLKIDNEEFEIKFIQELWRRNFGVYYKNVPRSQIDLILDSLLFDFDLAQTKDNNETKSNEDDQSEQRRKLLKEEENKYIKYAQLRLGLIKNTKEKYDKISFASNEEISDLMNNKTIGSNNDDNTDGTFETHFDVLIDFDNYDKQDKINKIIDEELEKIKSLNQFVNGYCGDRALTGKNIDPKLRWLMVIQSLRYIRFNAKSDSNKSNDNNSNNNNNNKDYYLCAYDCLVKKKFTLEECLSDYIALKDKKMKEDSDALALDALSLDIAKYILYDVVPPKPAKQENYNNNNNSKKEKPKKKSKFEKKIRKNSNDNEMDASKLLSFIGKMMVHIPTRGGKTFDHLIGLLLHNKKNIKSLYIEKVSVIMSGKYFDKGNNNEEYSILSGGSSWVHCPMNIWVKLKQLVGFQKWKKIEESMYGYWGHVYRVSDIPNRHGHCNSNPNSALVTVFRGFTED